jgi:ferredoxin
MDGDHRELKPAVAARGDSAERFFVVIEPQGWGFEAAAGVSLVESARLAGIVLPTSCRNGTCRTCICQLTSGRARHLVEWPGLSAEEKLEGCILPCVATPESDLRIEVPHAFEVSAHGAADPGAV